MFRHSVIKGVKSLYGITVLIIVGIALIGAGRAWQDFGNAERVSALVDADRALFLAAVDMRAQIGVVGVSLLTDEKPEHRVQAALSRVHELYVLAVQELELVDTGLPLGSTDRLAKAYASMAMHEAQVRHEALLARSERDVARIEPWRQSIYRLAAAYAETATTLGTHLQQMNPDLADLVSLRELSYAVRDRFALQCSRFRRSVEFDIPLTQHQRDRWQRDIGAYQELWRQMEQTARHMPSSEHFLADVALGKEKTAASQAIMSNVLNNLSGSGHPADDPTAWSEHCKFAYGAILGIGYKALSVAADRAERSQTHALVMGTVCTVALLFAIVFSTLVLHFLKRRLSAPLSELADAAGRLENQDYDTLISGSGLDDEPGRIAKTLESMRQKTVEAEIQQHRIDQLRDELVDHASKASRAKSQFLAMMSHEIRTPLNGILGTVQLLKDSTLTAEQSGWTAALEQCAMLLHNLVSGILDYARLESGQTTLDTTRFSLRKELAAVNTTLAPTARNKELNFHFEIAEEIPDQLMGDSRKLVHILLNLLGNAVKFTPSGDVALRVTLARGTKTSPEGLPSQVQLQFEVQDTGIGIPKEARARIFAPFTQADSTVPRRFGGSGLGLSICKGFLDVMGGHIECICPPEGGSLFRVTVPFANAATDARPWRRGEESAEDLPSLLILLAEDNAVNAMICQRLLERAGHKVQSVPNGSQAVEAASNTDFDVILMDLSMPDMDGVEATRKIRELGHETRRVVPVIAITADLAARQTLGEDGKLFDGFVGKPYHWSALHEAIAYAIGDPLDLSSPGARADGNPPLSALQEHVRDIGMEGARKIVELYLSETPSHANALRLAHEGRDLERIAAAAHRMKGSAGHLGLASIFLKASEIEKAAERDAPFDEVSRLVELLLSGLDEDLSTFREQAFRELNPNATQTGQEVEIA